MIEISPDRLPRLERKRKKERGICSDCTAPIGESSSVYCEKHFQMQKARNQKAAKIRRENKICIACTLPLSSNSLIYCDTHRERHQQRQRRRHKEGKETGVCSQCKEPLAGTSRWYCKKHLAEQLQKRLARKRQNILKGICCNCGKVAAAPFKRCENCRARDAARKSGIPLDFYLAQKALKTLKKEINHYAKK